MKFFIDTADIGQIEKAKKMGVLDGVTTNPTLIARETDDFETVAKRILKTVDGPVSLEAVSEDSQGMIEEARHLSSMGDNVVVKVPMTPEGIKAVKELSSQGIDTNVTLVFSANQALIAAKAGATYVSPFLGRLDDQGWDGLTLIEDIMQIYDSYGFRTQVIAASVRHPVHITECAKMGCHIATIPADILERMFCHTLTDKGISAFLSDWEKVKCR